MSNLPIEVPEWLKYLKNDAGVSSKDLAQIFGYKNQKSFMVKVHRGNFAQPDFQGKKIARGSIVFFWKKETVLKEIERINNGIKLDETPHEIIKMNDRGAISAESRMLHTEFLS